MPTPEQLANPPVATTGGGSTQTQNDDGSTTTTWPDGTTRVDYQDQSAMIAFPDGAVLNLYPDRTRTLNDQSGKPLDPSTGQPLQGGGGTPTAPETGATLALRYMNGDESIGDVGEAIGLLKTFGDAVEGEIDPVEWAEKAIESILQVVKAMEIEERGCEVRGWCYSALYGALGMGTPAEPSFSGSLGGADQDALDKQKWEDGVNEAQQQLAAGNDGVALRNRILLCVARDGGQPATTLNEMWQATCQKMDDHQLAEAYPNLSWPQPIGA